MVDREKIFLLRDRAAMLAKARTFFADRGVIEVDCPCISASASVDAHIDLIPVTYHSRQTRYLHSSPEYGMKRLLADGIGDIYQLSHVFRDGELGTKHNPEFMMAEWYRIGISFSDMIQETMAFIRLFLEDLPDTSITYRAAFLKYAGFDYLSISEEQLLRYIKKQGIAPYHNIANEGKDALLNIIMGYIIEPNLGQDGLCALTHYPASQAALSQTTWFDDEHVAERFEIYHKGVELCNGYNELCDADEQYERLVAANAQRAALDKSTLPIDQDFLNALKKGLPDCCGVAVGVDRLMMLRHNKTNIADVIPFPWS